MQSIIGLAVLIVIAAALIWLGIRAWRIRSGFLKWAAMGLAATLALAAASVSALTIAGLVKQHSRSAPVPNLKVEATPERIARGKTVADGFCSGCHARNGGTLTGGLDLGRDFPIAIGSFVSSNLTSAGRCSTGPTASFSAQFATESMRVGGGWC